MSVAETTLLNMSSADRVIVNLNLIRVYIVVYS